MSRRNRIYTLLHDPQYRVAIAWQNTAYNQPPHPGFFIGANMATPPTPNIVLVGGTPPNPGTPTSTRPKHGIARRRHRGREHERRIHRQRLRELVRERRLRAECATSTGAAAAAKTLRIRYALGVTASRTGRLVVNGVAQNITFKPTGAWTTWQTQNVTVTLNNNTRARSGSNRPARISPTSIRSKSCRPYPQVGARCDVSSYNEPRWRAEAENCCSYGVSASVDTLQMPAALSMLTRLTS